MIGTWMLYSIVVTGIVSIAGHFAESACLLVRRSTRTVWVLVLFGAVAIPIFAAYRPNLADLGASGANPLSIGGSEVQWGTLPGTLQANNTGQSAGLISRATAILAPFDKVLLGAWVIGSALWLIIVLVSATRVRRGLTHWKESVLDEVTVRVSDDIGPALAGVFRYRIVIPAWVANLSREERAFVLEHEREHARARDPAFIALSAFFIVLMPWNVALWYVQRRLRMAIELDCDMRVLRRLPDVRAYGSLLINVGERSLSRLAPLAAFAEPISSLKKRIEVMASGSPTRPVLRAVFYFATASALVTTACRAPKPTTTISPADRVRSLSLELAALLRSDPTLATNVVSPELYKALDSTMTAEHGRDSMLSATSNQPDATTHAVISSRQLDSGIRRMKSQSDSLARLMANMPALIDTLRLLAKQLEPAAFDSVSIPSSVAVGLVLGAHDLVLRHSLGLIAASGDLHAGYDAATGSNFTISGGLTKRLFPNMDLQSEIRGITIARVAGKEGGRRVVVIALRTTR